MRTAPRLRGNKIFSKKMIEKPVSSKDCGFFFGLVLQNAALNTRNDTHSTLSVLFLMVLICAQENRKNSLQREAIKKVVIVVIGVTKLVKLLKVLEKMDYLIGV